MSNVIKKIGSNIRAARKMRGLTQEELGEKPASVTSSSEKWSEEK